MPDSVDNQNWQRAGSYSALVEKNSKIVKIDGKQIALFFREGTVYACNNRCPHEGYPLKEGTISGKCILTCNWHNWKFDLATGVNQYGGDHLRIYPVRIDGDDIWLDVADAPSLQRINLALTNLLDTFPRHEYDRMAREIARLEKAGGDPLDAVCSALEWTYDKLKFGLSETHAPMAAADWLELRKTRATTPGTKLMPILEIVAHLAWDTRREQIYPYFDGEITWDGNGFIEAIEQENEEKAVSYIRGALRDDLDWTDIEPAMAAVALAHYQDFGHSTIYVIKTGELLAHLGPRALGPVILALTRGMVMATREDLIPEFRQYSRIKAEWHGPGTLNVSVKDFSGLGAEAAMRLASQASQEPAELYHILFEVACNSLLHFDLNKQDATQNALSQNCTWLDVTHEITFANAARQLCEKYPDLWHDALLQMCCFFGRNVGYQDTFIQLSDWYVEDIDGFINDTKDSLFDHSQFEYIVTAHMVKTTFAVDREINAFPDAAWKNTLVAGLNRFLNSPLKRRHSLRTANQALSFVDIED
jgi:nitrite reductase/ring-hydroxylating ferredoxin subunit